MFLLSANFFEEFDDIGKFFVRRFFIIAITTTITLTRGWVFSFTSWYKPLVRRTWWWMFVVVSLILGFIFTKWIIPSLNCCKRLSLASLFLILGCELFGCDLDVSNLVGWARQLDLSSSPSKFVYCFFLNNGGRGGGLIIIIIFIRGWKRLLAARSD
jgi:hypothetical protein